MNSPGLSGRPATKMPSISKHPMLRDLNQISTKSPLYFLWMAGIRAALMRG